jgi:hypothetical protein
LYHVWLLPSQVRTGIEIRLGATSVFKQLPIS